MIIPDPETASQIFGGIADAVSFTLDVIHEAEHAPRQPGQLPPYNLQAALLAKLLQTFRRIITEDARQVHLRDSTVYRSLERVLERDGGAVMMTLHTQAARASADHGDVATVEALWAGADDSNARRCAGPGCDTEEKFRGLFKACGRCGKVHYCSRACQVAHWRAGHKQECTPRQDT